MTPPLRWDDWTALEPTIDPHEDADPTPDPPRTRRNTAPIPAPCDVCLGIYVHFPERHEGRVA